MISLFQHSGCSLGVVVLLALFGLGDSFRYKKLAKEMENTNTRTSEPAAVELRPAAPEASELGTAVGNLGV